MHKIYFLALEYILFLGYLLFFSWLVTRVKFFTKTGLSSPQLIILFLLKVLAGIFYGWIGRYYGNLAQMQDTWGYHLNSLQEYQLLLKDPVDFFTNIFYNPYDGGFMKFFISQDSYWSDIKGNFFIKILSIFNLFSFGHYYVNVIIYSFVSLFGPIAIFRVMNHAFPGKRLQVLLATFLIPSFLYWCSGIHKEGLIFLGISIAVYHVYFASVENKITIKRIFLVILGLMLMMILRNFLIIRRFPLYYGLANFDKMASSYYFNIWNCLFVIGIRLFLMSGRLILTMISPRPLLISSRNF